MDVVGDWLGEKNVAMGVSLILRKGAETVPRVPYPLIGPWNGRELPRPMGGRGQRELKF